MTKTAEAINPSVNPEIQTPQGFWTALKQQPGWIVQGGIPPAAGLYLEDSVHDEKYANNPNVPISQGLIGLVGDREQSFSLVSVARATSKEGEDDVTVAMRITNYATKQRAEFIGIVSEEPLLLGSSISVVRNDDGRLLVGNTGASGDMHVAYPNTHEVLPIAQAPNAEAGAAAGGLFRFLKKQKKEAQQRDPDPLRDVTGYHGVNIWSGRSQEVYNQLTVPSAGLLSKEEQADARVAERNRVIDFGLGEHYGESMAHTLELESVANPALLRKLDGTPFEKGDPTAPTTGVKLINPATGETLGVAMVMRHQAVENGKEVDFFHLPHIEVKGDDPNLMRAAFNNILQALPEGTFLRNTRKDLGKAEKTTWLIMSRPGVGLADLYRTGEDGIPDFETKANPRLRV